MLIDETTYILPDANYVKAETIKKQIVILPVTDVTLFFT
jgi:hypothetical protein